MKRQDTPVIRPPKDADAQAIAGLLGELGYPATADEVVPRLAALRVEPAAVVVWVAELGGRVVGTASARAFTSLHTSVPVVWLVMLVVDAKARGRGVGKALVQEAERWARQKGAARLSLTSGLHRAEAHDFYKALGYEQTGVRLAKIF